MNRTIRIISWNRESFLIMAFSILPIIDSLNGFLIRNNALSIGTTYKFLLVLLLFIMNINYKETISANGLKLFLCVIVYIGLSILINVLLTGIDLNKDYPLKLLFNIMLLLLLFHSIQTKVITGNTIYKIFNVTVYFMIACILIPYVLKTGYTIYANNIGYKGFFYSQNELNASLIILFYFCLYKLVLKFDPKSILQTMGITICVLMTNTKSSMIAVGIGMIILIIDYLKRKESKHKLIFLLAVVAVSALGIGFFQQQIMNFISRQGSLYSMYSNSLIDTLTSGRLNYVEAAWQELIQNKISMLRVFIGNGFCSKILCEMDIMDMFFFLGLFGVAASLIFFAYILKRANMNFKKDHSCIRFVGLILIFLFSFFTGHVFFMATSGCYFVLLCCFDCYYELPTESKIGMRKK